MKRRSALKSVLLHVGLALLLVSVSFPVHASPVTTVGSLAIPYAVIAQGLGFIPSLILTFILLKKRRARWAREVWTVVPARFTAVLLGSLVIPLAAMIALARLFGPRRVIAPFFCSSGSNWREFYYLLPSRCSVSLEANVIALAWVATGIAFAILLERPLYTPFREVALSWADKDQRSDSPATQTPALEDFRIIIKSYLPCPLAIALALFVKTAFNL